MNLTISLDAAFANTLSGSSDLVESLQVPDEVSVRLQELNVSSVLLELAFALELLVLLSAERSESPKLGYNDLLLSGELVSCSPQCLDDNRLVGILASNRQDDLANVDTGDGTVGFAPSTTHTGLETICTGAGQHLVDSNDVVRVYSDTHVEGIFSRGLCHVFVGADTGSLECFRRELLVLVRDEMGAEGEFIL